MHEDEYEEVDALPVLSGPGEDRAAMAHAPAPSRTLRERVGGEVVVQAAAVATASFAVGAATVVVARRRKGRSSSKRKGVAKAARPLAEVVATRRFVVDVHLLGDR